MSKILIVGDVHGDWGALNQLISKKKPDIILQTGDFGWWPKMDMVGSIIYSRKSWSHQGVKTNGTTIYWCDGNHEDHEDLDSKGRRNKDQVWCYEDVIYQPRGSVLRLPDGRRVLFFGGADSIDKGMRTPGHDWFDKEIPDQLELERALSIQDPIDIVISHTAPECFVPDIARGEKFNDPTRVMLQMILEKHKPALWYCGHWHHEKIGVSGDTRFHALDYLGHGGRSWVWLPS